MPNCDPSVKTEVVQKKSKLDNSEESDEELTEKLNKKWQKQLASAQKANEFEYTKNSVPTISLRHSSQTQVNF